MCNFYFLFRRIVISMAMNCRETRYWSEFETCSSCLTWILITFTAFILTLHRYWMMIRYMLTWNYKTRLTPAQFFALYPVNLWCVIYIFNAKFTSERTSTLQNVSLFQDAVTQKTKYIKEINSEALLESSNVAREYGDNSKGNYDASSKCILSTNVKRIIVNGDFASQIEISANLDSRWLFYEDTSLHNQKINDNDDDDEQEANMQIIAKHLSTLRNYLLFATARDCSILMTFRELHP